jgi:UDP-glucose 4-epimerase
MKVIITGSEGLVGTALKLELQARGHTVFGFDTKIFPNQDVRDAAALIWFIPRPYNQEQVDGIIHLAACSRVVWGEKDPAACIETNVVGTVNLLRAVAACREKPWVLFASSREVYGNSPMFPVYEEYPMLPVNTYGRTKAIGEDLITAARGAGIRTGIIRLSSVYGSTTDHADRVVPAFARAAAFGGEVPLVGPNKTFDYVHVSDVARGLAMAGEALHVGPGSLPTIHLTTSIGTTLSQIANQAWKLAAEKELSLKIKREAARQYEVVDFTGSSVKAKKELGWAPRVLFHDGFRDLVQAFRDEGKQP